MHSKSRPVSGAPSQHLQPHRHQWGRRTQHFSPRPPFSLPPTSFCWEHRPEQEVQAAPEEDTVCLVCLDPVGDAKSYSTIVCPVCQEAWFHRGCIQAYAFHLGYFSFCCPYCQDGHEYRKEMLTMGIRIPDSPPSWEENMANTAVNERHRRCNASLCLYQGGREKAEREGPWQLLLCSSCGAESTHRRCSFLSRSRASWECDGCAGLGTASSASSQIARASTARQRGAGPSRGSPTPGTSSPSTSSQEASRQSHSSPALDSGSCSNPPGPDRTRNRSRLQRRAQIPYSRPRGRHESSREQARSTESSTPSQAGLGPSHGSPAPNTSSPSTAPQLPLGSFADSTAIESGSRSGPSGPVRIRESSRMQRRAQLPYSRPRRRRSRSRVPGATEESSASRQAGLRSSHRSPTPGTSSPSTTRQLPSRSSSGSPVLESGSRSRPSGPVRTRESSRVQRRAQNPYSRPRRRRRSSRARSPSAGPDRPPPAQ